MDRGENFHPATTMEFFTTIPDTLVATMSNVPELLIREDLRSNQRRPPEM